MSGRLSRERLVQLAIAAGLALAIAYAWQRYRAVEEELTEAALARRIAVAHLAASKLSERFDRLIDVGVALATRVRFRELVSRGDWTTATEILRSVPRDFPMIERIVLLDNTGRVMSSLPEMESQPGRSAAHRDWFKAVSHGWQPHISSLYRAEASKRNVFSAAIPIHAEGGAAIGVLLCHVNLERFFDWTSAIDLGPGSRAVVLDAQGQVAFHPAVAPQGPILKFARPKTLARHRARLAGVDIERGVIDPDEAVAAYVPSTHGWGVVAQQSSQAAFAVRDTQLRRTLGDYIVILSAATLAIFFAVRVGDERRRVASEKNAREELERQVAARTRELEASNRDLEAFAYSVSHDLRAPLRGIDGYARILEEESGPALGPEGKRLLANIRAASGQMANLIRDLLDFARFGRGTLEAVPIDMEAVARAVAAELVAGAEAGHARFEVAVGRLPACIADPALIRQVWSNLIGNAIKYSSLRTDPKIEIGGNVEDGDSVFWVKDNGVGFDMKYYDKLFGVFQRLHGAREFSGTGVGLAIVHRIVTRHGGRVWAESAVGCGATFFFSLPAERRAP